MSQINLLGRHALGQAGLAVVYRVQVAGKLNGIERTPDKREVGSSILPPATTNFRLLSPTLACCLGRRVSQSQLP